MNYCNISIHTYVEYELCLGKYPRANQNFMYLKDDLI